jgi:hypothetical protein
LGKMKANMQAHLNMQTCSTSPHGMPKGINTHKFLIHRAMMRSNECLCKAWCAYLMQAQGKFLNCALALLHSFHRRPLVERNAFYNSSHEIAILTTEFCK